MTHYEQRIEQDLARIRRDLAAVADRVDEALHRATRALLTGDHPLAYQTILGDLPINRAIRQLDRLCHRFIALHLPSAGYLRTISSILRMNIALERIGDYAVTICREVVQLSRPLEGLLRSEIEQMAENTFQMFRQAMRAFNEGNEELARGTRGYADQIDRAFAVAFQSLLALGEKGTYPLKDLIGFFAILNRYERVSDQSKNICEETVFCVTGETKPAKVYRILFLEPDDAYLSQMAAAIGRKVYPGSGAYQTAGTHPAPALSPELVTFLEQRGHDLSQAAPHAIDWPPEEWRRFHVVVSLNGPISRFLDWVPFQTVALEWTLTPPPEGSTPDARLEHDYRQLAARVSELMELLRGEDAP